MTNPADALAALRDHFSGLTAEEFEDRARRYSPELLGDSTVTEGDELRAVGLATLADEQTVERDLVLFRPEPARIGLDAYLASALTGLDDEQRQLVFQISNAIGLICDELDIVLYEPRKKTDPVHHGDVKDTDVFHIDRERVLRSDLLIYLAHYPSTGAGEELDFAFNALVPIIVIAHRQSKVSRMITGIPALVMLIDYEEPEEMRALVRESLAEIRPLLVQRKLAFGEYDVNIVGDRIRRLRERQGLTRADVAAATASRFPISEELLARLEESTDRDANPSLLHLREIATTLKTTVADLVEPDLQDNLLSSLGAWIGDRQSARFSAPSNADRNKLLRRVLLRLIDSLEDQ